MSVIQKEITIQPKKRGFHIITKEIEKAVPELKEIRNGIAHIFIKHTSASLSVNENVDPDVRADMETHFNKIVPESASYYQHTLEGSDDMTSHIKATMIGSSVIVPVTGGRLNLGTWQGVYLCEHRNSGGRRMLVITIIGE